MTRDLDYSPVVHLLAPVPLDLLDDAVAYADDGEVAFGSRAWEVFRKLDELRTGLPVRVWIYASHDENRGPRPQIEWTARYVKHVESVGGAHPDGDAYRSPLAQLEQNSGYWAVYWHVDRLRRLEPDKRPPIASIQGLDKPRPYGRPFEPEGPLLIEPVG